MAGSALVQADLGRRVVVEVDRVVVDVPRDVSEVVLVHHAVPVPVVRVAVVRADDLDLIARVKRSYTAPSGRYSGASWRMSVHRPTQAGAGRVGAAVMRTHERSL
jgi:hypothetical protein